MDNQVIEAHPQALRRSMVLWLAAYPLAWVALYPVSNLFWFLPAGLRLATLWLLPRRTWWIMALLEWLATIGIALQQQRFQSIPGLVVATTAPWLIYALVVRGVGRHGRQLPPGLALPRLLACGALAAIFTTVALTAVDLNDDGMLALGFEATLLSYALGDFAGCVIMVPLLLTLHDQLGPGRLPWPVLLVNGQVLVPMMVLLSLAALPIDAPVYPLMVSLLAMFVISYRFGWRQGAIALALMAPALPIIRGPLVELWSNGQLQLLIAASGCAALLLGVSSERQRVQRATLSATVEALSFRSRQLADAANRIAALQEEERRRIGVELHDQIGQDMTAIATRLRVVERTAGQPDVRAGIAAIGALVNDAHEHLREVINQLHPAVLDRFGLGRALAEGPFADMLRFQGIDYRYSMAGNIETLPDNTASALYRICQEAATNAAKHGCGGYLHIHVAAHDGPPMREVTLEISDGAGALAIDAGRPGRGLLNIRDRAHAIGAEYRFNALAGAPRHAVRLDLGAARPGDAAPG